MKKIIVIGAGPAGMMAAGFAARAGAHVTLLEKMDQPGKKLLITGHGRCNITNQSPLLSFVKHVHANPNITRRLFSSFFHTHLLLFFQHLGVEFITEERGRVFPQSQKAQTIRSALHQWLQDNQVAIRLSTRVTSLDIKDNTVTGVTINNQQSVLPADAVIIACGGTSYPLTGSTGDGFTLATQAGHTLVPPLPGLVPLSSKASWVTQLQGLSMSDVGVHLMIDNTLRRSIIGDLLFTHTGVSGPAVLALSGMAVRAIAEKKSVRLSIDCMPTLDQKQTDHKLLELIQRHHRKQSGWLLGELLPRRLAEVCSVQTGIARDKLVHQIDGVQRKRLRLWIKDLSIPIHGHGHFNEAMITTGGVPLEQIDPSTLASRRARRLYFAGEILDLDADTGGYNLQIAFTTGAIAGENAAK